MAIVRQSIKRDAMLALLRATGEHPSAEQVYRALKPDYPGLSLATVYRNLAQLCEQGHRLSQPGPAVRAGAGAAGGDGERSGAVRRANLSPFPLYLQPLRLRRRPAPADAGGGLRGTAGRAIRIHGGSL